MPQLEAMTKRGHTATAHGVRQLGEQQTGREASINSQILRLSFEYCHSAMPRTTRGDF